MKSSKFILMFILTTIKIFCVSISNPKVFNNKNIIFSKNNKTHFVGVKFKISDNQNLNYFLTFESGNNGVAIQKNPKFSEALIEINHRYLVSNTNYIPYKIVESKGSRNELNSYDYSFFNKDVISNDLDKYNNYEKSHVFYLKFESVMPINNGTYEDTITIQLYKGSIKNKFNAKLVQQADVNISVKINRIYNLVTISPTSSSLNNSTQEQQLSANQNRSVHYLNLLSNSKNEHILSIDLANEISKNVNLNNLVFQIMDGNSLLGEISSQNTSIKLDDFNDLKKYKLLLIDRDSLITLNALVETIIKFQIQNK